MRTKIIAVPACLLALGLIAGCGGDDPAAEPTSTPTVTTTSPSPTLTQSPTQSPTPTDEPGVVIEATIRGNDLEPNGKRVAVPLGEPITIVVKADRAGELHVHTTPEQELAYAKGTTRLELAPITTPGLYEVEDHVAEKLLVSLEVS
ncbi:MAG TPA: hypothetical protein VLI04_07925 [Nocardioidaceae bacterium]|nr:hypothetical protein [Nocardioidaceae bacterium]